ncbi:MAG: hypothetical protein PHE83_08845 [Opitutaceae bacterium]|nr:hypothetical protein [Opitutaceae bacterium]
MNIMNHCRALIIVTLAGGLLFAASGLSAADNQSPGLIGKRYYGVDLSLEHYHSAWLDNAIGGLGSVNLPVAPGFDAAIAYGYSHLTGTDYSRDENTLSASVIAYSQDEYGKPYFSATLGEAWNSASLLGVKTNIDGSYWALGAGLEVPFGQLAAVTYSIGYSDSFSSNGRNPTWRYGVQGNYWFTPKISGIASVSYNQIRHAPDTWLYTLGVRVLF